VNYPGNHMFRVAPAVRGEVQPDSPRLAIRQWNGLSIFLVFLHLKGGIFEPVLKRVFDRWRTIRLLKKSWAAPCCVGKWLKMLMYSYVHCAFSPLSALPDIHRRLFQQPAIDPEIGKRIEQGVKGG
jgi:hypothetical protein